MYFTFHAVRFAAVFALAGKNIVILLVTLSENLDYILCTFFFLFNFLQLSILVSQQLSPVAMGDAYPTITAAITTMTVEITVMNLAACSEPVTPTQSLLAIMEGVYLFSMSAMESTTVMTMAHQMRGTVVS